MTEIKVLVSIKVLGMGKLDKGKLDTFWKSGLAAHRKREQDRLGRKWQEPNPIVLMFEILLRYLSPYISPANLPLFTQHLEVQPFQCYEPQACA